MTDTTSTRLRTPLLGFAGVALGFAVAVSAFLGPVGWVIGALLLAGLCWLTIRLLGQGGKLWLVVGVSAAVGVLLYIGLALVQSLTGEPESGSDESDAVQRPGIEVTPL